jgi:drug/metabolite transporter superfamily protein YnfA
MGKTFNGVMRVVSSLIGLLMTAMGGIWILQGLNIAFLRSFMANDKRWALYGAILAIVGICQVIWSNKRLR